jgi:hypothetical protein
MPVRIAYMREDHPEAWRSDWPAVPPQGATKPATS